MPNSEPPDWPIEEIPSECSLYYRVPKASLKPNQMMHPSIFKENLGSMSTDWENYSSAIETLQRSPKPENYSVIKLLVAYIRNHGDIVVEHSPILELVHRNRAHTDVKGITTKNGESLLQDEITQRRLYLFMMYEKWNFEC